MYHGQGGGEYGRDGFLIKKSDIDILENAWFNLLSVSFAGCTELQLSKTLSLISHIFKNCI